MDSVVKIHFLPRLKQYFSDLFAVFDAKVSKLSVNSLIFAVCDTLNTNVLNTFQMFHYKTIFFTFFIHLHQFITSNTHFLKMFHSEVFKNVPFNADGGRNEKECQLSFQLRALCMCRTGR